MASGPTSVTLSTKAEWFVSKSAANIYPSNKFDFFAVIILSTNHEALFNLNILLSFHPPFEPIFYNYRHVTFNEDRHEPHFMVSSTLPVMLAIWYSRLEAIKLEFILNLKIKLYCWLLADTNLQKRVRKQPIIALYFEIETVLKF